MKEDVMYYRLENVPRYTPEPFGTTFSNRYNLAMLARPTNDSWPSEVPREHWAYKEYDKLSKIGLLPDRFPSGFWSGPYVGMMSRYQFAIITARLTDEFETNAQTAKGNPDAKNAVAALQKEFAPEINALGLHLDTSKSVVNGQTWQHRYEYLSLYFSYGKKIDMSLATKINQIIADYANSIMKSTTPTSNVSAQK